MTLVMGLALVVLPFLTRQREVISTVPGPPPLAETVIIELGGGDEACVEDVTIDRRARQARFTAGAYGRPGAPLAIRIAGPSFRFQTRVPGGYEDPTNLKVAIDPPREPRRVDICIENLSKDRLALYGSAAGTSQGTTSLLVEGERRDEGLTLRLEEGRTASFSSQADRILERMATFRPLGRESLILVAILLVVLVPLGSFAAVLHGLPGRGSHPDQRGRTRWPYPEDQS